MSELVRFESCTREIDAFELAAQLLFATEKKGRIAKCPERNTSGAYIVGCACKRASILSDQTRTRSTCNHVCAHHIRQSLFQELVLDCDEAQTLSMRNRRGNPEVGGTGFT